MMTASQRGKRDLGTPPDLIVTTSCAGGTLRAGKERPGVGPPGDSQPGVAGHSFERAAA